MKRLILTLSICLYFCTHIAYAACASDEIDNPTDPSKSDPNLRPKAPARKNVSVVYAAGYAYLTFASTEGECVATVSVFDMPIQTVAFDSAAPMPIYIGNTDNAIITICTELGNTYYVSI